VESVSNTDPAVSRARHTSGRVDDYIVRSAPPKSWPGLGLGELWRYRRICLVLTRRSLMIRYRQTLLGVAWTIGQPTLLMIIFTVFFGVLGRLPSQGIPWPVFYYLGILPWHMTARILNEGSASIVANGTLLNRVYFPRAYFPIAAVLASLVDFLFGLVPLAILLLFFGIHLTPNVLFVPMFVGMAAMTGLGVAFLLSSLNASYRDITQMLPAITQAWFFLTPIIYPVTFVPARFQNIYALNPMVTVVTGLRWAFAGATPPTPEEVAIGFSVGIFLIVTGYLVFRHREPTFADVV
jgi:lipopolysaccharide transport system permease protein